MTRPWLSPPGLGRHACSPACRPASRAKPLPSRVGNLTSTPPSLVWVLPATRASRQPSVRRSARSSPPRGGPRGRVHAGGSALGRGPHSARAGTAPASDTPRGAVPDLAASRAAWLVRTPSRAEALPPPKRRPRVTTSHRGG